MINRSATLLVILSIFTMAFASPTFAVSPQTEQDKKTEKVKQQVKKIVAGDKVTKKVKMQNGTTYLGSLSQASDDSFVITDKTVNPITVKYSDVKSIDKKDVPTALKVGIGAGAAVLVILIFTIFHRE